VDVMAEINQWHREKFNTNMYVNITNNCRHNERGYPLLLLMYESGDFSESELVKFFKKITNIIGLMRLL
jgi:hypothetical protein